MKAIVHFTDAENQYKVCAEFLNKMDGFCSPSPQLLGWKQPFLIRSLLQHHCSKINAMAFFQKDSEYKKVNGRTQ